MWAENTAHLLGRSTSCCYNTQNQKKCKGLFAGVSPCPWPLIPPSSSTALRIFTAVRIKMIKGRSKILLVPKKTEGHIHLCSTQNFGEGGTQIFMAFLDKGAQFAIDPGEGTPGFK